MTHTRIDEIEALQGFDPGQPPARSRGPRRQLVRHGLRLLALGATPGEAHDTGGTL